MKQYKNFAQKFTLSLLLDNHYIIENREEETCYLPQNAVKS